MGKAYICIHAHTFKYKGRLINIMLISCLQVVDVNKHLKLRNGDNNNCCIRKYEQWQINKSL